MRPARRLGHHGKVVGGRAVGRDHLGENAGESEDQHQHHADRTDRLADQEGPRDRKDAARREPAFVGEGGNTGRSRVEDGHGSGPQDTYRQARRMRGSSQAYSRSTTRLLNTASVTVSITNAWVSV